MFDFDEIADKREGTEIRWVDSIRTDYKIEKLLGQGGYGKVYKARHRQYGFECAIKLVKKSVVDRNQSRQQSIKNEMKFLQDLQQ